MLVLTRRQGQRIVIGDDITIIIHQPRHGSVKLCIDAPRDVRIIRGELLPEPAEDDHAR